MASTRWVGGARKIAQLRTWTMAGTWVIGETITVAYGTRTFVYAVTSATIATFLPLLATACNALLATDYPEHAEQTAGSSSTTFTLTADAAGKPFLATLSTNSAAGTINGGASSTGTATTASTGPNDVATAANYSAGALPVNNDTLNIDPDATFDLLYSLEALAALTGLTINHTGSVKTGLPPQNTDGTAYPEYRQQYLQTAGGTINLGAVSGSQSLQGTPRFRHDAGAVAACTWNVYLTGSGQDSGMEAALLKGSHASNALNVLGRSEVGVAVLGGETATLLTLRTTGDGAYVRCGSGVTLGTVTNDGGTIEFSSAVGTALNHGPLAGQTTVGGTGAVAQLTALGGTVVYNTTGTLGGATVLMGGALLDFGQGSGAVTVSAAIDCFGQAGVSDPYKRANGSGNLIIDFNGMDLGNLGANCRLTRSATA